MGVEQLFLENGIVDGKRSNGAYINLIKWNKSLKEMKKWQKRCLVKGKE